MSHKILVSDPISEDGLQSILKHPEFDVDIQTDLSENDLVNMISTYDALIVRSQTQVTERIINAATNLKVIARAGVGVDNINIEAATLKGILVINAPDGNTISATEHSVAMLQWHEIFLKHTNLYVTKNGIVKHLEGLNFMAKP